MVHETAKARRLPDPRNATLTLKEAFHGCVGLGLVMLLRMKGWMQRIGGAVLVAAIVTAYGWLLWKGPWWFDGGHLRESDLQPADGVVITGFRTALVALGAGAIAGLGLYYTHRSHQHTERLFEHTRQKDREQAELTREGQVTERYVEAIKLLSSDNLTQRLGGIYALERIMRDSEKDHQVIVEVLASFVRQHAPIRQHARVPDGEPAAEPASRHPEEHVQAAVTVLGRRPERAETMRINLSGIDLHGADLRHARLVGLR